MAYFIPIYCYIAVIYGVWTWMDFSYGNINHIYFMPKELYNSTKMNIVGCYINSLIIFILNPIYCIPMTIYWLFHIGREN